ncbi:Type IV secretion system protein virB4 [Paraburkholderia aspalathi]|uniref:Type IV secretion system protein virB4 n=1 Tax=Paraburkholderia aspalathi TaxID=1324617 RepID=A0ABM8SWJ7_9BURK|nr:type IV secretion system protein VirB4 [Paraburkholderia aspalathi]MBK3822933.1 type IV secretion system protein VirB4 [Paraburkholderia aspalathi]MBK3834766.1 type IV secretion system protein VirB4 [Paraburkholderia aspalathi]MBK3864492.1 type IV secretion system protein VirB4 [Paraburkholderia aspalathi]CAE6837441.1 Type IV secretion system protein virB4 [Paraburkholderia aspalathi]
MLKKKLLARSIQEIAPWATMVTPELVLNKDGSLLTTFTFGGIDADSPNTADISAARDNLDRACKNFDHRVTAWWRLAHRRVKGEIEGEFATDIDERIDSINRKHVGSGKYFRNTHSLALAYTPETGVNKIFDKIAYHMTVGGKSMFSAIIEAAKDSILARSAFVFDIERLTTDIKRFELVLDAFKGSVTRLRMKRLPLQDSLAFLHQSANPSVPPRRIRYPVTMLDSHLTETMITIGADTLMFDSAYGKRYARIVAVKEWLGFQEAALDILAEVDAELDVCVMFRFLDTAKATSYIEKIRKFYKIAAFNPWAILKAYFSKEEQKNDKGRERLADEAEDALEKLVADGQQYGFANVSVIVYGDTFKECEDATSAVVGKIGSAGFGVIVERDNVFAAWSSTLPGRWDQQRRLQFVETAAASDIVPLRSVSEGGTVNEWLTQQSGQKTGPLTMLPTRHKTLQRVNLHRPGGASHLLVLGPIGMGKSIILNFLMSQTGRHGARRVRFDKDRSTRIPTVLAGGRFIDATGRFEAATSVNPLSLLHDKEHYPYVAEWVQMAIEDDQFRCTKPQERTIFQAVETLGDGYGPELWTLSHLNTLLPDELREWLAVWTQGEKNGRFFDHVEDAFALSDDISIEMGDLFQNFPVAAALFMDYAFYRIAQWLDGKRYTVIEVEEAGFFFQNERFYKRLEIWAVTIRKLNATLMMATQSLAQVARIADFEVLKENIPNIIYLPNPDAKNNLHLYQDKFGLTPDQITMISDAVPNRDYLWVTPDQTRMLQASFAKETLAVLRSDGRAQAVLDKHYTSGAPGWREAYLREMVTLD